MKIAVGMIVTLFVLSIIYFFLPPGIKTKINAVLFGTNTQQTRNQPSPTAQSANATTRPINILADITPRPTAISHASTPQTTVPPQVPSTIKQDTNKTTQESSTSSALPGTGFEHHNGYSKIITMALIILLLITGIKLRKYTI